MKSIDGVVFDIGGVFVKDPWEWMLFEASNNIADQFNLDKEMTEKAGTVAWKSCDRVNHPGSIRQQEETYWNIFLKELDVVPEGLTAQYLLSQSSNYIETINNSEYRKLLSSLISSNIELAICSNNTEFWFAHEWETINLQKFFQEKNIILSNNIGATKSSEGGEMFHAVQEALGIPFERLLFIDDRIHNVEKAQSLGMDALFVESQDVNAFVRIEEEIQKIT